MKSTLFLSFVMVFGLSTVSSFAQDSVDGRAISGEIKSANGQSDVSNFEILNSDASLMLTASGKISKSGSGVQYDLKFEGQSKAGARASYGSMSGLVSKDASEGKATYTYGGGKATLAINNASAKVTDAKFSGRVVSPEKAASKGSKSVNVERVGDGKKLRYSTKTADSISFQSLTLAKGPTLKHPEAKVSGEVSYESSSQSWIFNGLSFAYSAGGKNVADKISGGLAYVGDAKSGTYDVSIIFNDDLSSASGDAVEVKEGDLRQYVKAHSDLPTIYGQITVTTQADGSTLTKFDLSARNGVKEHQVLNLFKFFMTVFVPFNS